MYFNEEGEVRTFIVERHPFKGVKNYFTYSFHQDSFETIEDPSQKILTLETKQILSRNQKKSVSGK